jgi:hypothetical protein
MNSRNLPLLMIASLACTMLACETPDRPARREPLTGAIDEAVPGAATAPRPVVDTSFEDVRTRKHGVGERVRFHAKILPGSLIQTNENGTIQYFALAAYEHSVYIDDLQRLADELRELQKTELPRAAKLAAKPEQFKKLASRFDELMGKLEAAHPAPEDLVAIELADGPGLANIGEWKNVLDESTTPSWPSPDPTFGLPLWAKQAEGIYTALDKVEAMSQRQPPSLETPLPDLRPIFVNRYDDVQVYAYNRLVRLYNQELKRRLAYLAQRMAEDVVTVLAFIDDFVKAGPHIVEGHITANHALASRTFGKIHDGAPRVYVREANGSDTFVKRHHTRAHLLITSYPTGATVSIGGEAVGKTPYLMRDLPVGSSVDLTLARRGHATFTQAVTVDANPHGVDRFEGVLQPARRNR